MSTPMSDEDLLALLPDYLNNALTADTRKAVEAYLARSSQARIELDNLQLILAEMDRIEEQTPQTDEEGRRRFLAYAKANPLGLAPERQRWWRGWSTAGWLKPAFAMALMVIVGQGALIGHLIERKDEAETGASRSLTPDTVAPRVRGPVLSVQVAPDAPFADVVAVILDVHGRIISGPVESTMLFVELSGMSADEASKRLKQSRLVLSVIEVPTTQAER